jgi:8-oxo-dGTP pyrophosphatase MutT (NUDIX family)
MMKEGEWMEWNDIYDENRRLTGRVHKRGTPWKCGEYGLVVCVWVHDGHGKLLLTRRAKGKSFAGTWENSGGAAKAGEDSLSAVVRELFEETGIRAEKEDFEFLGSDRDRNNYFDHYCLKNATPLDQIVLLPGETDAAKWVTFRQVHRMIQERQICSIIASQFFRLEQQLLKRQSVQGS